MAMLARVEQSLFGDSEAQAQVIDHYRIIERLGTGGMGVVYAAYDPKLERKVALKVLRRGLLAERGRERLLAEARTLAKLSHPNVVAVHGVDVHHDGEVYVVMELVDGDNLSVWQRQRHSVSDVLAVYLEAGAGLAAAHAADIVHRDFKPANVLLGREGLVKVADFGLASSVEFDTEVGEDADRPTRSVVGTRGYIAPELWDGEAADARSDQFAFCVSLWEAVVGELPFMRDEVPASGPRGSWSGPRWLRRALVRGMRADPSARWPSMDALLARLDRRTLHRRVGVSAALATGLTVGVGLAQIEHDRSCVDPSASFDEVWTQDRSEAIVDHVSVVAEPYAGATLALLDAGLARYRKDWVSARTRICGWTGEQRQLSRELAISCLDRQIVALDVLLTGLSEASAPALARVEQQLAQLDDPSGCEVVEALNPHPLGDIVGSASLVWGLAEARFALAARDYARATELAQAALVLAVELERPSEQITALDLHGRALIGAERFYSGEESLLTAARLADDHGDHQASVDARQALVEFAAQELGDGDRARHSLARARAQLEELEQPLAHAGQLVAEASLVSFEGDHAAAAKLLEQAASAYSSVLGEGAPRVEEVEQRRANALAGQGEIDAAMEIYSRLITARRDRLGPAHPALAELEFNLALALRAHDQDAAIAGLERALSIELRAFGEDSLRTANTLTWLAELHWQRGENDEAVAFAERAWRVQLERAPSAVEDRRNALGILAWIELERGNYERALAHFERVPEPRDPQEAAVLAYNIAWLRCRVRGCVGAEDKLRPALVSANVPLRLAAQVTRAEIALHEDGDAHGREQLEALEAQLEALPSEDAEAALAEARWLLARSLAQADEPQRVRDLAEDALAVYRASGWPTDVIDELVQLASCGRTECEP